MDFGRTQTIIVLIAFLWFFVASNSNGNRNFAEAFISNGVSLDVREIDDETANEIWIHCSRGLKGCIHFLENLELYLSQASSRHDNQKFDIDLLTEGIIEEVIPHSPFQEKQFLFECLRKKNLLHHESTEDFGSNTWFSKCQELFPRLSAVPRRFLRHRRLPHNIIRLAQAPASGPAALDISSPSPSHLVPSSSPSPILPPPSPAVHPPSPEPSPLQGIVDPRTPKPQSPQPLAVIHSPPQPQNPPPLAVIHPPPLAVIHPPPQPQNPPPLAVIHPPPRPQNSPPLSVIHPPPRTQDDAIPPISKYQNVVIAAASLAGLALVIMIMFCCMNRRKDEVGTGNEQQHEKRDEKPLLNFCASDVSDGSPQKSENLGNFSNKNFKVSSTMNNTIAVAANDTDSPAQTQLATLDARATTHTLLPLPPGRLAPPPSAPPPPGPPPPPPPPNPPAPPPPPLPEVARAPPNPPKPSNLARPSPLGGQNRGQNRGQSSANVGTEKSGDSDPPKTKLKPFFWEKVMANPEHAMVWNEIKAGSFQFNEEMMESLFGYIPADKGKFDQNKRSSSSESATMYVQIIEPKKAQNIAILLKALNVTTEEVCDALKEGNELPTELVETLLRMSPTTEEELKLRLFNGDASQLGPAERFLKVIVEIPFAFKRMESLLFMSSLEDEISSITESFRTLEVACEELRNSRLFLKLLEAVLKTGNRMNVGTYRGGAMAFKLDTLLKLSDVKGTDGKTTLLHFVVQEIIRSEGLRAARRLRESHSISSVKTEDLAEESSQESAEYHRSLGLQVVSGLSSDLGNVRKAALIDGDNLTAAVSSLGQSLLKTKNFLNNEMMNAEEDSEFCTTLSSFIQQAETDITKLLEEEKRIMVLVRNTGDYFHGNAGKDEGLRLFVIVRDFLIILDKACKDVQNSTKMPVKISRKEAVAPSPSQESHQESLRDLHQRLFPAIKERRTEDSSSDDED